MTASYRKKQPGDELPEPRRRSRRQRQPLPNKSSIAPTEPKSSPEKGAGDRTARRQRLKETQKNPKSAKTDLKKRSGTIGQRQENSKTISRNISPEPTRRSYSDSSVKARTTPVVKPKRRPTSPLVYGVRLLIVGVGIGAIAGTVLSILDPASRQTETPIQTNSTKTTTPGDRRPSQINTNNPALLPLHQEIPTLKAQITALITKNPQLQPGLMFIDLDTGAYVGIEENASFAAASTIKIPVLVAFFQDVDAGKIRLDELLTIKPEVIGSGSGEMQYKKPGTQFTALETITKMITISDNTATNMIVARLGGIQALNQRFTQWGLTSTVIHNALPDLEGTNTTSPKDMAMLMAMVNQGNGISARSRDRLIDIMQHTVNNSLLPKGLGTGATIAHKTGDIGAMIGDIGLIDMPNGKRYIAAIMVKRPHNNSRAPELIRQISRAVYQQFSQPPAPKIGKV